MFARVQHRFDAVVELERELAGEDEVEAGRGGLVHPRAGRIGNWGEAFGDERIEGLGNARPQLDDRHADTAYGREEEFLLLGTVCIAIYR
jgi:hypothetical protein